MKTKKIFAVLSILSVSLFASMGQTIITATNSGNWSDPTIWNSGTVPGTGTNDAVDVEAPFNVTVDTNEVIHFIAGGGTITMGTNSTLTLLDDAGIAQNTTLNTTNIGNTVKYTANPFNACKQCNYYNLVLFNTNFVPSSQPFYPWQDFNNFSSSLGPTHMTIAGNMTLMGAIRVQQANALTPGITIGGNLIISQGCEWDCSSDNLTVVSNLFIYGELEDLDGASGTNNIGGNVIVSGPSTSVPIYSGGPYTNGWYVSDVTTWGIGGSLTNNGSIFGTGFGSITFNGTGIITGTNALTLPTMTVNGTYTIGDTITLTTNTPTLHGIGTLVFDLARTNQIVLRYSPSGTNAQTTQTNFYDGNLIVINSGVPPVSGNIYKFFSASNYAGAFISETFPSLAPGLSWVDSLLTNGSIAVTGTMLGKPTLTLSRSGNLLTLSWDSTTFPGYSVQAQTNNGIGSNWSGTGSGTVSPFPVTINPTNRPVFFRLSHP